MDFSTIVPSVGLPFKGKHLTDAILRSYLPSFHNYKHANYNLSHLQRTASLTCGFISGTLSISPGIGLKNSPPSSIVVAWTDTLFPVKQVPLTSIDGWSPPVVAHSTVQLLDAHVPTRFTLTLPMLKLFSRISCSLSWDTFAGIPYRKTTWITMALQGQVKRKKEPIVLQCEGWR